MLDPVFQEAAADIRRKFPVNIQDIFFLTRLVHDINEFRISQ